MLPGAGDRSEEYIKQKFFTLLVIRMFMREKYYFI